MAFYGCEFTFDGLPCSEFGLMLYNMEMASQSDVTFKTGEVHEDRIASRYDALMYGLSQNEPLEFTLVFGANTRSIDAGAHLDRFEIEAIAAWLTGHSTRKWLTIVQEDMEAFRYKCLISDLKLITYGELPWAFSCTVSCDSPFGYTFPEEYEFEVSGSKEIILRNRSTYNGFYKPIIEISMSGGDSVSITNASDSDRTFSFKGLPAGEPLFIYIDNKNQVITNNLDINLYPNFNMKFFRMKRGDNHLVINGNCKIKFICEFPVNIGG